MKPPFVISTIKWLPYPKNKPEKAGQYLISAKITKYSMDGVDKSEYKTITDDWVNEFYHNTNISYWADCEKVNIIAFAELPIVDDSEEFDFCTALELMKQYPTNTLKSCVSNISYFLTDGGLMTVGDGDTVDECIGSAEAFTLEEVMGKWRLAE